MIRAYRYRIYPNKAQQAAIETHFNAARFVFNLALETKIWAWKSQRVRLSAFDLINQLPELKRENKWLSEVFSQSLQSSIKNIDKAFEAFFSSSSGFPKFKKKNSKKSYCIPSRTKIDFAAKRITLPKIGEVKFALDKREIIGVLKSCTVHKTATGKYFASLVTEPEAPTILKPVPCINNAIGVDLGIKSFITTSTGDKVDNPQYLKTNIQKLSFLTRVLSFKKKGSNRHKNQKLQIAKNYEKISNQRLHFLHSVSNRLLSNNQTVCVETLRVTNLMKRKRLSRSIADCSWSTFISILQYKAEQRGVNILRVGQFAPTSKACSSCGHIYKDLTLKEREWACICGQSHDRDINAAINILHFAFNELKGAMPLSSSQSVSIQREAAGEEKSVKRIATKTLQF